MDFKVTRPIECPFSREERGWNGDAGGWLECVVPEGTVCVDCGDRRGPLPEYCPLRSGSITVSMEKGK